MLPPLVNCDPGDETTFHPQGEPVWATEEEAERHRQTEIDHEWEQWGERMVGA